MLATACLGPVGSLRSLRNSQNSEALSVKAEVFPVFSPSASNSLYAFSESNHVNFSCTFGCPTQCFAHGSHKYFDYMYEPIGRARIETQREQTCGHSGGKRGSHETHVAVCELDSWWEAAV